MVIERNHSLNHKLASFMAMRDCIFCNRKGTTKEHIIPRWLQKHFDLKDQKLQMVNKTTIQYCRVVLPACETCNSQIFSKLESKVKTGKATDQEYYLWALKIRYCLSISDSTMLEDRSDPSKGTMLVKPIAEIGHEFIKHSFTHLSEERFLFSPCPFGSVFLINSPQPAEFGFVDITHPFWGLTITLPSGKILSVLFTDRGLVKRSLSKRYKPKGGFDGFRSELAKDVPTQFYAQYLTFRLLIAQYQISNIPYGVILKDHGVFSLRTPAKIRYRGKLKKQVLDQIADFCGLPIEISNNAYKALPSEYRG